MTTQRETSDNSHLAGTPFDIGKANGSVKVLKSSFDIWINPETKERKPVSTGHKNLKAAEAVIETEQARDPNSSFAVVVIETVQRVVKVMPSRASTASTSQLPRVKKP